MINSLLLLLLIQLGTRLSQGSGFEVPSRKKIFINGGKKEVYYSANFYSFPFFFFTESSVGST